MVGEINSFDIVVGTVSRIRFISDCRIRYNEPDPDPAVFKTGQKKFKNIKLQKKYVRAF